MKTILGFILLCSIFTFIPVISDLLNKDDIEKYGINYTGKECDNCHKPTMGDFWCNECSHGSELLKKANYDALH